MPVFRDIGRQTIFGNPVRAAYGEALMGKTLPKYREYLEKRLKEDPAFKSEVLKLRDWLLEDPKNRKLMCPGCKGASCKAGVCHGHDLMKAMVSLDPSHPATSIMQQLLVDLGAAPKINPGRVDTRTDLGRLLSNMHKLDAPVMDRFKIPYLSVEQAYQAAKTLNPEQRKIIAALVGPSEQWYGLPAKAAGRKVTLEPGWEERKLKVMKHLLGEKFKQARFAEALLSTGTRPIAEVDPRGSDMFWGVDPSGQGQNQLGRLLSEIRALIGGKSAPVQSLVTGEAARAKLQQQAPKANPLRSLPMEELLRQIREGQ